MKNTVKRALCIGISGGSGSGKTFFASFLKERLGSQAVVVCQDWYYKDKSGLPPEKSRKLNFDHPSAIELPLLEKQLKELLEGRPVLSPRYDYASHARLPYAVKVLPAPILLLDGLLLFCFKPIRKILDISIFIDVPSDIRLVRRIRRDVEERRVDLEETLSLYERTVVPMFDRFILPSSRHADKIWRPLQDGHYPELLLRKIKGALAKRTPRKK